MLPKAPSTPRSPQSPSSLTAEDLPDQHSAGLKDVTRLCGASAAQGGMNRCIDRATSSLLSVSGSTKH